jgi:AraC family transcriptional regulator
MTRPPSACNNADDRASIVLRHLGKFNPMRDEFPAAELCLEQLLARRRNRDQMPGRALVQGRFGFAGIDMEAVKKALWYIESHSAGPLTLGEVAEASGLSRFHLARLFVAVTGYPVFAYLRARRLTEAARELANGAPDILSVALDAGYGSHEAFTRAFRDLVGLTPEEVRARRRYDDLSLVEPIRMSDTPAVELARPSFRDIGAMLVAGIRQYHSFTELGGIPAQWQRFNPHIGHIPGEIGGSAYGVCTAAAAGDQDGLDYVAGVAVRSLDELPEGLSGLRVPARRYAIFEHEGHVSSIGSTCAAIFSSWLPGSGYTTAEGPLMMIEHYDERFDPQSGQGGVEIWVPLKA